MEIFSEPIRDRKQVKWRVLAIGGSTTFGEGLPLEKDTWVYQLEQLVRQSFGGAKMAQALFELLKQQYLLQVPLRSEK